MKRHVFELLERRQHFAATLTRDDVWTILGQAGSQAQTSALREEVIAVVDRQANVLGVYARSGVDLLSDRGKEIVLNAVARARTAALFESNENAFTSRSARFIIQDHFPQPINGTPGGPLYGVQFSNLIGSDVVTNTPAITGDPGGIPLYKDGVAVGGVGAAGDGHDTLARADLDLFKNYRATDGVYDGHETADADESIALAGAAGFMASKAIRADRVFLDGLRVPFTASEPAEGQTNRSLGRLLRDHVGNLIDVGAVLSDDIAVKTPSAVVSGVVITTPPVLYPAATFAGVNGILKRPLSADAGTGRRHNYGIEGSGGNPATSLTSKDVRRIITDAVTMAQHTRAGIREPDGVPARVHVTVVDTAGNILGVFAEDDATNFSYDVAVQKARTANFFSDDTHAFSTRAIGFLSQQYFPIGIEGSDVGPLYHVQNELSTTIANHERQPLTLRQPTDSTAANPLKNGITVFPGGVPLYKNGVLIGAVGVSGDGVDQDDRISFAGASHYQTNTDYRSDNLGKQAVRDFIASRAKALFGLFGSPVKRSAFPGLNSDVRVEDVLDRLENLDYRLPYVKFPRNPDVE